MKTTEELASELNTGSLEIKASEIMNTTFDNDLLYYITCFDDWSILPVESYTLSNLLKEEAENKETKGNMTKEEILEKLKMADVYIAELTLDGTTTYSIFYKSTTLCSNSLTKVEFESVRDLLSHNVVKSIEIPGLITQNVYYLKEGIK